MKRKPTIAITGANGFVGTALVEHFSNKGWQVVTLTRDNYKSTPSQKIINISYDLEDSVDPEALKDIDYLIHAAYAKNDLPLNVSAAEKLLAASEIAGIKQVLFVSSMSAHDNAISTYGKQKRIIEKKFWAANRVCVRPGLIAGDGGIFKNILFAAKRYHVIPVISGGKQPVQLIKLNDLVVAMEKLVTSNERRIVTVAHPTSITYKELYKNLFRKAKIKVLFVPLPYWLAYIAFRIIGLVLPHLGVSHDNLAGLKKLKSTDTSTDMGALGLSLPPMKEYLASIEVG